MEDTKRSFKGGRSFRRGAWSGEGIDCLSKPTVHAGALAVIPVSVLVLWESQ